MTPTPAHFLVLQRPRKPFKCCGSSALVQAITSHRFLFPGHLCWVRTEIDKYAAFLVSGDVESLSFASYALDNVSVLFYLLNVL